MFTKPGAGGPVSEKCHKCRRTKLFCVCSTTCIVSCCQSCTFCVKCERAVTKERRKSLVKGETRNKFCERCFFCRSLRFCPHCSKCPQCCQCSADRGTSPKILAEVVPPGCKSESSVHLEGRLHSPIQKQTSSGKRSFDSQWLCKPPQEPLPAGGFASPTTKGGSRDGEGSNISSLLQQTFQGSWTSVLLNKFLRVKTFKMETPETIRISLQQGEWVTSLDFSDAYFHIPVHVKSRKYLRFHFQNQSYQFRALLFGLSTAPMEFTCVVKEVKLMAQSRGIRIHQYLDDWLIRAPTKESCYQGTQSLLALCQELGWVVNLQKSELEPKQVFEFVGYQYDLSHGLVKPTQNRWESILQKVQYIMTSPTCRVGHFMSLIGLLTATEKQVPLGRLHMRPIQWHLKRHLRVPESLEKDSSPEAPSSAPSMVDQGDKCPTRPASAPFASCHSNLYRCLKRRLGCSLRRLHSKQYLVSSRKSPSYKLPGTKSCLASLKKISALSTRKSSSSCHRQHHSCGIHQQGGRYEVRLTLCPSMATPVLVQSETGCPKGQAHPWSSKCD